MKDPIRRAEAAPHAWGMGLLGLALPLSLVASETLFAILLALWMWDTVRRRGFAFSPWELPVLAFLLLRLMSGLLNPRLDEAIQGLTYLLFAAAYALTAWRSDADAAWRRFLQGLVVGGSAASLLGIWQIAAGAERVMGFYGGWTVVGSLTGAALVLGTYQALGGELFRKGWLDLALLMLNAAGLAATTCRAEWIAAVLLLLPAGVLFYPRWSIPLGAGVLGLAFAIAPLRDRLLTLADPLAHLSGREILWQPALDLIRRQPLFGYGLNSFHSVFPRPLRPWMSDPGAGDWHNVYLQVAVESGLVGEAAFLAMLLASLYLAGRAVRRAQNRREQAFAWSLFAGLAFFAVAGGMGTFLVRIPVVILVFLILGRIRAVGLISRETVHGERLTVNGE